MFSDINGYIRTCVSCQRSKRSFVKPSGLLQPLLSCMATGSETQQHSHVPSFCNAVLSSRFQISSSKIQQNNLVIRRHQNVALMQISLTHCQNSRTKLSILLGSASNTTLFQALTLGWPLIRNLGLKYNTMLIDTQVVVYS